MNLLRDTIMRCFYRLRRLEVLIHPNQQQKGVYWHLPQDTLGQFYSSSFIKVCKKQVIFCRKSNQIIFRCDFCVIKVVSLWYFQWLLSTSLRDFCWCREKLFPIIFARTFDWGHQITAVRVKNLPIMQLSPKLYEIDMKRTATFTSIFIDLLFKTVQPFYCQFL